MISIELAGTLTVIALVALGIFIYPWLLDKRGGVVVVTVVTVLLAVAYFFFDRERSSAVVSALLGLLWALAPVIAALITRRTRGTPGKS